jgi:predicted phosphodiesterase
LKQSFDKVLMVGDPHATIEELPDCERMVDRIIEVVKIEQPDTVLFLGDQHHNHAVVRVEIIDFWRRAYWRIRSEVQKYNPAETPIVCLIGNHDRPGDSSSQAHAMQAYEDLVFPVDQHVRVNGILLLSYHHDGNDFIKSCNLYPEYKTVICHQTFDGSKYENGFYAKDGIALEQIPQQVVISGHIHSPQKFGKVWYPGAPRWRTSSDVNIDRDIWVVSFKDGLPVKATPYETRGYCRALHTVEDREGLPEPEFVVKAPFQVTVSIYGSREYVATKRARWEALGYRVRSFPIEKTVPRVRESEGISIALQKFVAAYKPRFGTSTERLQKLVSERVTL